MNSIYGQIVDFELAVDPLNVPCQFVLFAEIVLMKIGVVGETVDADFLVVHEMDQLGCFRGNQVVYAGVVAQKI